MLVVTTPIHRISTERTDGGVLHVSLAGDFDMSVAAELTGALVRAARTRGVDRVVVDLRDTEFLDSHGIAALLAGFEAAKRAGRRLSVANAAGMVRQVLEITGLAEVFADEPRPGAAT
jgi:anti-anti-sigma factor